MKIFRCACGNPIYFENTRCYVCGRTLGYLPDRGFVGAVEPADPGPWVPAGSNEHAYRKCANYERQNVCNWMVPADDPEAFCHACRLNRMIPDLSVPENIPLWFRIEAAKRRLVYTLDGLGLPVFGKAVDPERGLAFEFLRDTSGEHDEFANELDSRRHVLTGHRTGVITINIAEADPHVRERMRERMNEAYRTLLGHFRHEIGHYYWDLLVRDSDWLEPARALFGDEREDYRAALDAYYADGPRPDWSRTHISAYASAHPWEDWAESWAHYLHMVDTLETAAAYGLSIGGRPIAATAPDEEGRLDRVIEGWSELTAALNALNRSMGMADAYPFAIAPPVAEKLSLIDRIIARSRRAEGGPPPPSRNGAAPKAPA